MLLFFIPLSFIILTHLLESPSVFDGLGFVRGAIICFNEIIELFNFYICYQVGNNWIHFVVDLLLFELYLNCSFPSSIYTIRTPESRDETNYYII